MAAGISTSLTSQGVYSDVAGVSQGATPDRSGTMRAALQQVAMFRIGGPLAASLPVLTLAVLPASTHAQEAPMSGDGAAVTPISLCVPPISKDDCPADHPIEGNKSGPSH